MAEGQASGGVGEFAALADRLARQLIEGSDWDECNRLTYETIHVNAIAEAIEAQVAALRARERRLVEALRKAVLFVAHVAITTSSKASELEARALVTNIKALLAEIGPPAEEEQKR